jgi:membrane protein DedA with SNARE-associated domain
LPNESANALAQYSALAFQMLFIILLGYFLGNFFDEKFNTSKSIFAIIGTTLAVVISLVWVVWKLLKSQK